MRFLQNAILTGAMLAQTAWLQVPPPAASQILDQLRAGNQDWVTGKVDASRWIAKEPAGVLAAVILACAGAGVPPELLLGQGPGELYVVRSARVEGGEWPAPVMVVLDQPHCAAPGKPSTARERVEERVRALVTEDSALRKKLQLDQVVLVGATTEESTGQVVFSKIVKPLDPAPVKRITVSTVSRTKKGEDYWNPAPVRKVTRTITPTLPAKPLVEWEDDARPPSGSEPAPIEIRAAALAAKK